MNLIVDISTEDILNFLDTYAGAALGTLKAAPTFEDHERALTAMSDFWGPSHREFSDPRYGHVMQAILQYKIQCGLDKHWSNCVFLALERKERDAVRIGSIIAPYIEFKLSDTCRAMSEDEHLCDVRLRAVDISSMGLVMSEPYVDDHTIRMRLPDIVSKVLMDPVLQPFKCVVNFPEWVLSVETLMTASSKRRTGGAT